MPFTVSHAAIALPILPLLPRAIPASALVIGTMTPDFAYFIPLDVSRAYSHSLPGLFIFCLPAGIAAFVLFQYLLKVPCLALLPAAVQARLQVNDPVTITPLSITIASALVLIGALSHVFWDSFTHYNGIAVLRSPILQTKLFEVGAYEVHVYKALQHLSTLVGGLAIALYCVWRLVTAAPIPNATIHSMVNLRTHAILTVVPALMGLASGAASVTALDVLNLRVFVAHFIYTSIPVFAVLLMGYAALWHAGRIALSPAPPT